MFGEGLKRQSFKESHEVQLWLLRLACVGTHRPAPSPSGCRPARDGHLHSGLVRWGPACSLRMPHTKHAVFLLLVRFPG